MRTTILLFVVGCTNYCIGSKLTQYRMSKLLEAQQRTSREAVATAQHCVQSMENLLGKVPREGLLSPRRATLRDTNYPIDRRYLTYDPAY